MTDKILILGWGRCGKDEAGAFFHDHLGLGYCGSTSWAALPLLASFLDRPAQLLWEQRHQNRQLWKDTLDGWRVGDPSLLIRRALDGTPTGRVVTGVRDKCEIDAAKEKNLFTHYLWIERPGVPQDSTVTFTAADCTDLVRNNGTLRAFHVALLKWSLVANLRDLRHSKYACELFADFDP